jgi:hypothetical protein
MAVATGLSFSSCNDLLDNDNKYYHVATQEQQWNSLSDARSALFGIYGMMRTALGENNTYWAAGDLRMGDFTVRSREDLQAIRDNRLTASYPKIQQIANWNRFYRVINAAAVFIENVGNVKEKDRAYSETNYRYDVAQAKALRALAYFYMVQIWGDVPLITYSYDNGTFPAVSRTDAGEVLNYAKGELLAASTQLPDLLGSSSDKYYGGDSNTWKGWLFNRFSCYAILAHIAAWEGNYVDVESYAGYIINNAATINAVPVTTANLVSATGIFSREYGNDYKAARLVAFGYEYDGTSVNEPTVDGHLEAWTLAEPVIRKSLPDIYVSKDSLFSIFMKTTTSDARFGIDQSLNPVRYYTNYVSGFNQSIPVFSKIKVVREGKDETNDLGMFGSFIILSRVEDIVLLQAEALCMLNRNDDAVTMLNGVRALRNLSPLSYSKDLNNTPKALLKEIFEERRRELMGEGHHWFDQIRRAKLLGDNPEMVELVNANGIYWPVANEVLNVNPNIGQTEYWK